MSYDYWGRNRFTQAEKKQEVLRDTFHSRAEADANLLAQGRFKKETETRVIGSGTPTYPQIPSGPWSVGDPGAPDAATDQLGYDINAVEPVLEQPTPDPDDSLVPMRKRTGAFADKPANISERRPQPGQEKGLQSTRPLNGQRLAD